MYFLSVDAISVGTLAGYAFEVKRVLGLAEEKGVFEIKQFECGHLGLALSVSRLVYEDLPYERIAFPPPHPYFLGGSMGNSSSLGFSTDL
jgi:hypothetical protein